MINHVKRRTKEMPCFEIINLGKGLGDCFFIHIKNELDWECVILVDGRTGSENEGFFDELKAKIDIYEKIDYMVVTHIDSDHVGGIIKLLQLPVTDPVRKKLEKTIVIYNYVTRNVINYDHAEILERELLSHTVISTSRKNYTTYCSPVLKILSFEKRTKFDVSAGNKRCAYLTLLHPDKAGIDEVYQDYEEKLRKGEKNPRLKLVNKQSIAFLLEFKDKKVLFPGDGEMKLLIKKVEEMKNMETAKIDLIKIPHHGAKENNEGLVDFAKKHQCTRFIVTGEKIWSRTNLRLHPAVELLDDMYRKLYLENGNQLKIYSSIDMREYEHSTEIFVDEEVIDE